MKTSLPYKKIIVEVVCCLYILLFVYAAVSKLLDYQNFSTELGQSPLLTKISPVVAPAVIVSELLIAIFLSLKNTRRWALLMSFALMTIFTSYIFIILNFSHYVPCSCGGILQKLGWTEHIVFNALFVALAVIGFLLAYPLNPTSKIKQP